MGILPPVSEMTDFEVATELQTLINTHKFRRPDRSITDPERPWLYGRPNYDKADLLFFRGRSVFHPEGSLEDVVENAVKTWEMEASHLPFSAWKTVQHDVYSVVANGSKRYVGEEAAKAGSYNWLFAGVDKELYDSEKETFETSHELFRGAFVGGFPWEVIKVFSPPPLVSFSWRHWSEFNGVYKGREGDGKIYNMYGFAILQLNDNLEVKEIQIFYKPEEFLKAMQGDIEPEAIEGGKDLVGPGCPFLAGLGNKS